MCQCLQLVGMDLGTKRDTVRERAERKEREKEKEKARERKARRKEESKARERATAGKEREIGGTSIMIRGGWNRSVVTVATVGNGGHKKAQCPQWQDRRPMELGAMVSHPSQTVVSDPGSSVSQRVQAVNSSPVSPVCWSESVDVEEDWPDEWWHDSEDCASEWYDNESAYLVCGVAGSSPSLNQQWFEEHSVQRGLCERLRDR